jgi:sugar phosphate isomerase/epimerase
MLMQSAKRTLADTGLRVWDAESARIDTTFSVSQFMPCLEAAGELGARYFVTVGDDTDVGRVTDNVAALTAAAASFGVRIAMEFMVYIGVNSWQRVEHILDAAGATDAAILIDALHLQRSGAAPTDLQRIKPTRLPYFQLCDALLKAPDTPQALREEARLHRLLPGEGELPLADLIRAMPASAAIAIEAPAQALAAEIGDRELAARALRATRALVQRAEESRP